ncbi:PP2C family protein-serine/threonine phosphatase [Allostreptomyces psammosilenae]|uniref:Serine/threonine protein phosphatase PrpC n=1 Tax=Allostreptomyces psammosilenae TaxID=1892865 RepID=A0A852ZSW4_9ACTN|nr:PP2C family protein-serine/threonine phosphatase [Allostreptomyces psammosilenae]NYI04350.1 serine/threonine protein phosphatase PrpC [Allostreptomyces psammosilenae]
MIDQSLPLMEAGALLAAAERAAPESVVDVLADDLASRIGARRTLLLLLDHDGDVLVPVVHRSRPGPGPTLGAERTRAIPVPGTPYGEVLRAQRPLTRASAAGCRVLAPVTVRGECVGVLEVETPPDPGAEAVANVATCAHILAYLVLTAHRITDAYELDQRTKPLTLAAEIQRRLLPDSYGSATSRFTLAGLLEPADDNGGDTFDHSIVHGVLHLSMTDAMGHDLDAAMLATLTVGALRNSRRRGDDILAQAQAADEAIALYGRSRFVTGQLYRCRLDSGEVEVVNAGHPPPLLMRDGRVSELPLLADPPFGALAGIRYRPQRLGLRPGDRLVLATDGMLEREAAAADLPRLVAGTRELAPREAVRRWTREVSRACGGRPRDDATVLCLDWHGTPHTPTP